MVLMWHFKLMCLVYIGQVGFNSYSYLFKS